jgi:NAD(P)-dependent dehydrogenase (short-subunit alcohol dehydrogenase family)
MKTDPSVSAEMTGGASGIGLASVKALRAARARVAIIGLNPGAGDSAARETGMGRTKEKRSRPSRTCERPLSRTPYSHSMNSHRENASLSVLFEEVLRQQPPTNRTLARSLSARRSPHVKLLSMVGNGAAPPTDAAEADVIAGGSFFRECSRRNGIRDR